ncbi:MAG TPA: Wzz/FepE/Etk N-terminal domain-containing protein [Bryocella sp.]|nr:Wzz/FepE/Etk N-terminal domain-containing protein [Bryocella sp.]
MAENDDRTITEPYATAWDVMDSDGERSVDLLEVLRTLWADWRLVAKVTVAVIVLSVITAFVLPVRYTSTASFIPPNNSSAGGSMAAALAGQLSILGGGDLLGGGKASGDLYAGILASRSVTSEIVQRFNLMHVYGVSRESKAEKKLQNNTSIKIDSKSNIVSVSVTDKNPGRARDIANAYLDILRSTNGRLALSQSSQRRLFFQEQLAKEKDNLEDAEVELKKTEEATGLIAPAGQTESEIRTLAETRAQLAARQVELASLRQSATEQNPDVIRLNSEIQDLQSQLAALQNGKGGGKNPAAIPTGKVPQLKLDYVRKEREVKYHEALFEILAKQYEAARLDEARDAPVLQVLDQASYPDSKSEPKRLYIIVGGLFAGLILGCAYVLVRTKLGYTSPHRPLA